MSATEAALATRSIETTERGDFAALLNREFRPKSERAKEEVESAVRTLAEQVLNRSDVVGEDVSQTIKAYIAEIDRTLTEQLNQILHHADLQQLEGAWRGLHYLVNNTETDQQLKIRVLNISKKELGKVLKRYKGYRVGSEPHLQESLRTGIWPAWRRAVWVPGRRLLLRPESAGCGTAQRYCAGGRCRARTVHCRRRAQIDGHGQLERALQSARSGQDFSTPDYAAWRSLRESEDSSTSVWPCRARSRVYLTARPPARWKTSISRKTPPARIPTSTPGRMPPMRWR